MSFEFSPLSQMEGFEPAPGAAACQVTGPISVVITCYNQGRFLREAIESVLAQSLPAHEIILVDDGSTDETRAVAADYPQIKYVYQSNEGLAAARNTGWRACNGTFVTFLDADDRLLPEALSAGLSCFRHRMDCAFVAGRFRYVAEDGRFLADYSRVPIERDHYRAFLLGNFIAMHATVLYRVAALEAIGGFNPRLEACEDYDLYLRMARRYPVCFHNSLIAEYRQHDANMSADAALMLRTAIDVLRSQKPVMDSNEVSKQAFRAGLAFWVICYGKRLVFQVLRECRKGRARRAARALITLLRYGPYLFYRLLCAGRHA